MSASDKTGRLTNGIRLPEARMIGVRPVERCKSEAPSLRIRLTKSSISFL